MVDFMEKFVVVAPCEPDISLIASALASAYPNGCAVISSQKPESRGYVFNEKRIPHHQRLYEHRCDALVYMEKNSDGTVHVFAQPGYEGDLVSHFDFIFRKQWGIDGVTLERK